MKNERSIPGFPMYRACADGRIWSAYCMRYLKPGRNKNGYLFVTLCQDGKQLQIDVHRVINEAFHGPAPSPLHETNHKNTRKDDNRATNLEWMTSSQNRIHAIAHGRGKNPPIKNGIQCHLAKLTDRKIQQIRRRRRSGETIASIAKDFGISDTNVSYIANRKTWKHIL